MAPSLLRWRLPFFTCWLLFVNHYSRDVTGALEKEIEKGFHIEKPVFGFLNSVYFIPNLVAPLVIGAFAQQVGTIQATTLIEVIAAVGHLLVGISASAASFPCLLLGRAVLGLCYESIDILPLPILGPHYQDVWGLLVGLFNAMLRMGSVCNFVISPLVYKAAGLASALWVSSVLGLSGLPALVLICRLSRPVATSGPVSSEELVAVEGQSLPSETESTGRARGPWWREVLFLPRRFWLFCCTGALMYSGIVPFWFFGGRYIQEHFHYDLGPSDFLMLLPEGMIALFSPIVGIYTDRAKWSDTKKLRVLSVSLLGFPLSFSLLLVRPIPPLLSMILLGSGWAFSNCLFWSMSASVVPKDLLGIGSGIIGAALNIGPTVLPTIMGKLPDSLAMCLLIAVSASSAALAAVTSRESG